MEACEIWRVPIDDVQHVLLRVVLAVRDLALPASHPMVFVNECFLVQVARPGEATFRPGTLLVDGVFLAFKAREAKRIGFELVGREAMSLEDVEFPCWLADDSRRGALFCRGEVLLPMRGQSAREVVLRWDVRLSPKYPAQLSESLRRLPDSAGAKSPAMEPPRRILGIAGSDVRYHPARDAILEEAGVDLSKPYWKEIEGTAPDRMDAYRRAVGLRPRAIR